MSAASPLPDGFELREATDADSAGVIRLIAGAYAEYPGCVMDLPGIDADLNAVASTFRDGGGAFCVVESVVGAAAELAATVGWKPVASMSDPELPALELKRLYVDRLFRRRGLGARLVDYIEVLARSRGAHSVVLWSDTRFEDAHRLYRRLGYEETGARRDLNDPSHSVEGAFEKIL